MCGVRAYIADTACCAGFGGIETPLDMRGIAGVLRRHPILHEFHMDLVYIANPTLGNDITSLSDHCKTGHHIANHENTI